MNLGINEDELNACVQCGLCLSSCPTYRVTGDETFSPRGRIALMREVQVHDAPLTSEVLRSFDSCIQCRACEPACPSVVQYGHLIEATRNTLTTKGVSSKRWQRPMYSVLTHRRLLRAGSVLLAIAQRLHLVPKRFGLSVQIPLKQKKLATSGCDVYMFTGCVMDAWQRNVHAATQRVLEAAGFGVTPTTYLVACCGALHSHAGMSDTTKSLALQMMKALEPNMPIVVNSAGCGAAMKEYGHIVGTEAAHEFSQRVYDIHEFLALHLDKLPKVTPLRTRAAIQDPCHLRHVQRVHGATRTVLQPFVSEIIELDDDGLCCGAGGAYSVLEPEMADAVRVRKLQAISRAQADVVASANPGCMLHLAAAGTVAVHPIQLVDQAIQSR